MIATTIEQSKHLLDLGLGPKTADMFWMDTNGVKPCLKLMDDGIFNHRNYLVRFPNSSLPAWSLDRIVKLICFNDNAEVRFRSMGNGSVWFCCFTLNEDGNENGFSRMSDTRINAAYEVLEYLLDAGYIKKGGEK